MAIPNHLKEQIMNNVQQTRELFQKLSTAGNPQVAPNTPLELLHNRDFQFGYILGRMSGEQSAPNFDFDSLAGSSNDFGCGLPPMANC
jgi:hypothetical protein